MYLSDFINIALYVDYSLRNHVMKIDSIDEDRIDAMKNGKILLCLQTKIGRISMKRTNKKVMLHREQL